MFEMIMGGPPLVKDTGPGPGKLIAQYNETPIKYTGYYGRLTDDQFSTYSAVITKTIPTWGTLPSGGSGWMKFLIDGKILFIPVYPITTQTITKGALYSSGVVYGVSGPGPKPASVSPVNQLKIIEIQGYQFIVRLLSGAATDPTNITNAGVTGSPLTKPSEWDRLMLNALPGSYANQQGPKYGRIDVHKSNVLVKEWSTQIVSNEPYVLSRSEATASSGYTGISFLWIPVLELVGKV